MVKQGKKDSKIICEKLKSEGIKPELMISSPANRAIETAEIFAKELGYPVKDIVLEKDIYSSGYHTLLRIVKNVDNKYGSVMLFGHDPSFSDFAGYLIKDFNEYMPKAGMLYINFYRNDWKRIYKGKGILKSYYYPKDIAQQSVGVKNVKKELESKIFEKLVDIFKEKEINISENDNKFFKKESKQLAKKFVKILRKSKTDKT